MRTSSLKRRRRAKTPTEARDKLRRLFGNARQPFVQDGSVIHLFGCGLDGDVLRFDPVGVRYLVRTSDGRETWEQLGLAGGTRWDLVQEPAPPDDGSGASKEAAAVCSSAWSDALRPTVDQCPICLDTVEDDRGVMPCCGKVLHRQCHLRWRNSNLPCQPVNRSIRSGKEAGPNTRACCWCKAELDGTSLRRVFGKEPRV